MPNIQVRRALEKIQNELNKVGQHVAQHSGVDVKDASAVDRACDDIAATAAQIGSIAREAMGNRSGKTLVKDVRRALGYTYP